MRVYGVHIEAFSPFDMKSTATYSRLPREAALSYTDVAREDEPGALSSGGTRHEVRSGENLTRIVREFLERQGQTPGNAAVYDGVRKVAEANDLHNPDLIHPRQSLDLSVLRERVPHATAHPAPEPVAALASLHAATRTSPERARPEDVLRDRHLTATQAPLPVANAATPDTQPGTVVGRTAMAAPALPDGVGGDLAAATAFQRLLNGTADALARVREIMEIPSGAREPEGVQAGPWEPVLNGAARLSSEYGMRKDPFTGRLAFHDGIDLAADRGTEITALRAGEVVFSGWKGGYGNTVVVRHDNGYETVYGHTAGNLVSVGDTVEQGAVLATVGSTGRSTGPHLHLEMRRHGKPVNPVPHLADSPLHLARNSPPS